MSNIIKEIYTIYKQFFNISTDSRNVSGNSLYFALKGQNFDGNVFAENAINNGAVCAIIDNDKYKKNDKYILVDDVLDTLQKLASYHRQQLQIPIIGITGTNGKTTTKELINAVISKKYKSFATKGNFNNHIGVPLSILSINNDYEIAIIEMGANHRGEIKTLCDIAKPDYGIITNIGTAHIEGFGSYEGVIKTKNELYDFVKENNRKLFVNCDNQLLMKLSNDINRVTYGSSIADFSATFVSSNPFLKISVAVKESDNKDFIEINSKLIGKYNFENILAAVAVGQYFDVNIEDIKTAIENYQPDNNRSQIVETNNNFIILDAYNANPSSMEAAISNFFETKEENKFMILGDMLELGEVSESEHKRIFNLVKENNAVRAIFVGPVFSKIINDINYKCFNNTNEAFEYLANNKIVNSSILIKGSRGIKLEKIVEVL